jgi:hypothetical protein
MIERKKALNMQKTKTMNTQLKRKRPYGPDVNLIYRDGVPLVEKTYRNKPRPVKKAGSLLVRWETYIYSKIKGITGIPDVIQSPDAYTITTTFMGGHDLKAVGSIPDEAYFQYLEELIKAVHMRGVVHLDMRNRRNYGMDDEGMPYLVDFATSLYTPFKGPLWRMLCGIDWMGYLKVKSRLNPILLSRQENRQHAMGTALSHLWFPSKIVPFLRRLFRRFSR